MNEVEDSIKEKQTILFLKGWYLQMRVSVLPNWIKMSFAYSLHSFPPPQKKNKQTNKQKKISVFKNGIIECATVSHSAGLFGFLEILFWLYLDPLCLSWILRQAFYGTFGFFKDRKCGGVPKVFNFKFLIPCVHASEITNRTFLISPVFYSISVNMVKIE